MAKSVEETLVTLKQLQMVDDQLAKLRASSAALSQRVDAHKKTVVGFEGELEKKAAEIREEEKASSKRELELKVIADKIAKLRGQLVTLTSNTAYATMLREIAGHEAESGKVEEDVLKIMDKIEVIRASMGETKKQIEGAKQVVRQEEAAVADEVRALSGQIRELAAERQGLLQQVDRVVADKYDRIAKNKNGQAIAPVTDYTCQGCHMGVTKQFAMRLWAKKEMLYCPNCGRMAYLEGEIQ